MLGYKRSRGIKDVGRIEEKEEAVRYSNPLENKTGEHPVQPVSAP